MEKFSKYHKVLIFILFTIISCSDFEYKGADITYRVIGTSSIIDVRLIEDNGKIRIGNKNASLPWEYTFHEEASRGVLGCDDPDTFELGFSVIKSVNDGLSVTLELVVDNLDYPSENIFKTITTSDYNTETWVKTTAEIYGPCF